MSGTPEIAYELVLPSQHHDRRKRIPLDFRDVVYGARIERRQDATGEEGHHQVEAGTLGDYTSGVFWQTADEKLRPIGGWRFGAWPALATGASTALPVKTVGETSGAWLADDRFEELKVFTPDGAAMAAGEPILVLDSQNEDKQEPLAFRLSGTSHIVHWRDGDPGSKSTIYHDIKKGGSLDKSEYFAPSHTLLRVTAHGPAPKGTFPPGLPKPKTLAINLTDAPLDGGHCYFYGRTPGVEDSRSDLPDKGPETGLGIGSAQEFGPFSIGYGDRDPHFLFKTTEGLAAVPLALVAETAWHPRGPEGVTKKGPLLFEDGDTPDRAEHPIRHAVHMTFDGFAPGMLETTGAWVWWGSSPHIPAQDPGGGSGTGPPSSAKVGSFGGGEGGGPTALSPSLGGVRDRRGAAMFNELCLGSLYGKPQATHIDDARYLNNAGPRVDAELARMKAAPVTWRAETYGALENRRRGWKRSRQGVRKYYEGGTGQGGLLFAAPEVQRVSITDRDLDSTHAALVTEPYLTLGFARLAFARRLLGSSGTPADGWQLVWSNGNLDFNPVDSSGAADPNRTVNINGNLQVAEQITGATIDDLESLAAYLSAGCC